VNEGIEEVESVKKFLVFFVPRLIFRFLVAGIAIASLVGAMLLGSVSSVLAPSIAGLASATGMSTPAQTQAKETTKIDAEKKRKAKQINKRMNWRLKRIAVANTLGAVTTIAVPVAIGFATYEAWMICENSNDNRKLLRLLGVEPEPDSIADTCEDVVRKWNETAEWVKVRVLGDIAEEESGGSVWVYYPGEGWVDVSDWNRNTKWIPPSKQAQPPAGFLR